MKHTTACLYNIYKLHFCQCQQACILQACNLSCLNCSRGSNLGWVGYRFVFGVVAAAYK